MVISIMIVLLGLVWAGMSKLLSGYWFGGKFLSSRIATDPGFAWVFAPIVPDAELGRLVALENRVGAGPYRAAAPLLVAISNATWLAEIMIPIGLVFDRTRFASLVDALALLPTRQARRSIQRAAMHAASRVRDHARVCLDAIEETR